MQRETWHLKQVLCSVNQCCHHSAVFIFLNYFSHFFHTWSLPQFLSCSEIIKCWKCFHEPWMEKVYCSSASLPLTETLFSMTLSPPHLTLFLCAWFGETALQCGQVVWIGFDLSSTAAQLTCVFDSWSFRRWILRKIWCHCFISKLCRSLWNQTAVSVHVCVYVCEHVYCCLC